MSALCFADSGPYVENGVHTTGAATLASNNAVTTGACGQIQAGTLTLKNAGCADSGSFTLCKTTNAITTLVAGTATVSPDEPFIVDSFSTVSDASTHFSAVDPDTLPMIVSAFDGKTLLVRLRAPQRRRPAAGH